MKPPERFAELWTDYLEGELDEAGFAELRQLLEADAGLLKYAADTYQTHRLLGLIVEADAVHQDQFVHEVLSHLPRQSDSFVQGVMADVQQLEKAGRAGSDVLSAAPNSPVKTGQRHSRLPVFGVGIAIAATVLAILGFSFWPAGDGGSSTPSGRPIASAAASDIHFTSLAHARFFGELLPLVGSSVTLQRNYVLTSGLVEISFPTGASAIVEGPAVFRALSPDSLALDVGRCSVHAPAGAEGFHVETPVTRVVDRGTRFAVSVAETSETEVQVIEGAADVYERSDSAGQSGLRLTYGDARKFVKGPAFAADDIPFDADVYRRELPDRVVSYCTTVAEDGGADDLLSVTMQRGGRVTEIPVEQLIPARVTWFKATSVGAFVCGKATLPDSRLETTSDHCLVTGIINPGGSVEPLTSDPVLTGDAATPGMAVQFAQPVTNGPGADVVFFDIQTFSNPADGDAFHVSPLKFRVGLRSHTIRSYDLTMESPNARDLTGFNVYMFDRAADSLTALESLECLPHKQAMTFRGLAVGIDLSDLGYAPGEAVEGLFFQDALDDGHHVDPVFIGGLPTI